jgi:N-formylglutamate amidohydrolase
MARATRRLQVTVAAGSLLLAAACASGDDAGGVTPPPLPPTPRPPAPTPVYDPSAWVTASDGAVPVVIIAPHGGDLNPDSLPIRSCAGCVTGNDSNTQPLAYEIAAAFERRIGRRPFLVVNRLHRSRFDGNRDQAEATGSHAPLFPVWEHWQASIDSARARAARVHPRAIVIDLHGHGHAIPRLELGYLLTATQLRLPNDQLHATVTSSSIARLHQLKPAGDSGAALVRGPRALGSRLAALGVPSVPSDVTPAPLVGEEYFNGGYNTQRHGSRQGGAVDAIQIESHFAGIRDTEANRRAFAEHLVTALLGMLDDYYGWRPPAP